MIGKLRTLGPFAWRNLWRNPKRTAITLIVVSVGLWSVLIFNSFLGAWAQSSKDATLGLLIGQGQIHSVGFLDDPSIDTLMDPPSDALKSALNTPAIAAWATRLSVPGVVQSEYKTLPVTILGVDPADEAKLSTIPGKVVKGRYLTDTNDDGVVIGLHLADRLKTGLGRRVILMSQSVDGSLAEQSFDVIGLFDADQATEDFFAFTGRAAGQKFLGLGDKIAEVAFSIPLEADLDPTIAALTKAAPDLDVKSWKKLSLFLSTIDTFMQSFIYISASLTKRMSTGQVFNAGKDFLALGLQMQINPDLMFAPNAVINLNDGSAIAGLVGNLTLDDNTNLTFSYLHPQGRVGSEFGGRETSAGSGIYLGPSRALTVQLVRYF